jgi:tetraacyldisaccharide 4'-kinase
LLAEELQKSLNVAIVSRGYRSRVEKAGDTLKIDENTPVSECGDEPFWLAQKLPKAQVWVGKNRFRSAVSAYQAGAEVIILDDGMQHRSLRRDFEIIVVDGEDPFGKGFFLPRGLLRDSPHRLVHADLIVVMDGSSVTEAQLRKYSYAPVVFAKTHSEISFQGQKVGVFCGIGRPQRFLKSVKSAGGEVVATYFKPDHDPFTVVELNAFADRSGAEVLVCTEKDQVKLPANFTCHLPVLVLPSRLEIHQGHEEWEKLLTNIREYHDRRVSSSTS